MPRSILPGPSAAGATLEQGSRGGFFDISTQAENALLIHRVRPEKNEESLSAAPWRLQPHYMYTPLRSEKS